MVSVVDDGLAALFSLGLMGMGLAAITIATLVEYKTGRPNFVTRFLNWLSK